MEVMNFTDRLILTGNGCMEWAGVRNDKGYGYLKVKGKMKSTHRFVVENHIGRCLSKDEIVRHSCDNPPCCNLEHLSVGNSQDNMNDKVLRNRQSKGETHGLSKVSKKEVDIIRSLKGIVTQKELASVYGIGQQAISDIQTYRRWS